MTDAEIEAMATAARAATPGEWYLHPSDDTLVSSAAGEIVQAQGEYMME